MKFYQALLKMMMNNRNYQSELDKIIQGLGNDTPSLLLHTCCAPCSSYCIEYLSNYFEITVLYYNPNIYPESEYVYRKSEQIRLIGEMKTKYPVSFIDCDFESGKFYDAVKGLENCREGGERCFECYRLRLEKAAETASEKGFDFFTTSLTISPLKNAHKINEIGEELANEYNVKFLPSDFKKREGFKRSIKLSKEYNLYRQNYCGCVFSRKNPDESVAIERLEPADYSKCSNIWDMKKQPLAEKWKEEIISGNRIVYVYKINGEFIGEGALVVDTGDPDYTVPNQRIYVSRMIVKKENRNCGIGSKILAFLIEKAKEMGYSQMTIGVDKDNKNALHMYRKFGFTEVLFDGADEYGEYYKLMKRL